MNMNDAEKRMQEKINHDTKEYFSFIRRLIKKDQNIYIWGAAERSEPVRNLLLTLGFEKQWKGYIDSNKNFEYEGMPVVKKEDIERNSFIFLVLEERYHEIVEFLEENGFKEWYNCIWTHAHTQKLLGCHKGYADIYGNVIIGSVPDNVTIKFSGMCNMLVINDNVKFEDNCVIWLRNFAKTYIGENSKFSSNSFFDIRDGFLYVGEKCRFGKNLMVVEKPHGGIFIEGDSSFGTNLYLIGSEQNGLLYIGEDCMVSDEVIIQASDAHPIYSVNEDGRKKHKNSIKSYNLTIHDHVWIGRRASILYGADIGEGSIVGFNSFVNKTIPERVSVAGYPAKIIEERVEWRRKP